MNIKSTNLPGMGPMNNRQTQNTRFQSNGPQFSQQQPQFPNNPNFASPINQTIRQSSNFQPGLPPQQNFTKPQNFPQPQQHFTGPQSNFNLRTSNFPAPSQNISNQQQNFASQNFALQNFNSQNIVQQNFPAQNLFQQNFASQNFASQNFAQQKFGHQNFGMQGTPSSQQNFVPFKNFSVSQQQSQVSTFVNNNSNVVPNQGIKGGSFVDYVPYQQEYIDYEYQEVVEYVPKQKVVTDYYAVEKTIDYQPQIIQEKKISYVPVETIEQRIEYYPVEKTTLLTQPHIEQEVVFGDPTQQFSQIPISQSQIIQQQGNQQGNQQPSFR